MVGAGVVLFVAAAFAVLYFANNDDFMTSTKDPVLPTSLDRDATETSATDSEALTVRPTTLQGSETTADLVNNSQTSAIAGWSYYGNPWTPKWLGNLNLTDGAKYSYRFKAKTSGTMKGFQNFFIANTSRSGYASGDGGTIRISLVPDDGSGLPNESEILAELVWEPGLVNGRMYPEGASSSVGHPTNFADHYWQRPPALTAGAKYHLIFENVAADPANNFLALDNPFTPNDEKRGPFAPGVDDWGLTANWGDGAGWGETTRREHQGGEGRYDINLMVLMVDGAHYGNSYIEAGDDYTLRGNTSVRQTFTPASTLRVDQLSIYGAGTSDLEIVLNVDGAVESRWQLATVGAAEKHYVLDTGPITLQADRTYQLEFVAKTGSFEMSTYRDGSVALGKIYPPGGSWHDGHSQLNTGNGWSDTFSKSRDLNGVAFRTVGS